MSVPLDACKNLEAGDLLVFDSGAEHRLYVAVLERKAAKLVLSMPTRNVNELSPIKDFGGTFILDDAGHISSGDDDEDLNKGIIEIKKGAAQSVAETFSQRILPNPEIIKRGAAILHVDSDEEKRNIILVTEKIKSMVFNQDYGNNLCALFEMFLRLTKNASREEMTLYLVVLFESIEKMERVKFSQAISEKIDVLFREAMGGHADSDASPEANDVIRKAQRKDGA